MRRHFYSLLRRYLSLFILSNNTVVEIDPSSRRLVAAMPQGKVAFLRNGTLAEEEFPPESIVPIEQVYEINPDYIVLSSLVHYERDIQDLLGTVHGMCHATTRLVLLYYSSLWRVW